MNTNDFELDRKSDPIEPEPRTKPRVSAQHGAVAAVDSPDDRTSEGGEKSVSSVAYKSALHGDFVDTSDGDKIRACTNTANRDMSASGDLRVSNLDGEMEARVSKSGDNGFSGRSHGAKQFGHEIVVKNGKADSLGSKDGRGCIEVGKSYDSMLSMFDEFAAGGGVEGGSVGPSKPVGYGYEIGDMVWGKVKSHPWWPGHIYSEQFASPSVRRSKREGHVLVAFFGDSSYGWFDPAELVPFDSNYEEKSRQIASKSFLKAVEEAVDELSRRRGLGLACRCRNAYNFRPTDVEGYFAVDVGDYEPGAVYSTTQIKKARESFHPREALAFMKQLALAPTSVEHGDINFIKNKATVLAYRKAVFEEYDETYAQAFGYQPVRPSPRPPQENAPGKISSRAPLSGRLVIAEALGKGKSSGKPSKAKDQAKKDKYLFKRRDEPKELKAQLMKERQPTSSPQPVYIEGSSAIAAGDYVLQKRAPAVSPMPEQSGTVSDFGDLAGKDASKEEKPTASIHGNLGVQMTASKIESPASSPAGEAPPGYSSHHLELSSSRDMGKDVKLNPGSDIAVGPGRMAGSGAVDDKLHTAEPGEATVSLQEDVASSRADKSVEGFEQTPSRPATIAPHGDNKLKDGRSESGPKKVVVHKRPASELSSDKALLVEKKKRKKELVSSNITPMMRVKDAGSVVRKVAARPLQVVPRPKENSQVNHQSIDVRASSSSDTSGTGNIELELPHLLNDLQALALDPFYGSDRRRPAITRRVFLKYRSLVYRKSLALFQPAEDEANEAPGSKSTAATAASDYPPAEDTGEVSRKKPAQPRPSVRPDDPTKGGRKRGPSDRQEEIAAKKKKKVNDIRSLTMDKKVVQKTPEAARESRQAVPGPKKVGQESIKRMEQPPPSRASQPTMLVMKFPPGGNIPSVNELKARFARFGQMDQLATRSFWKTLTCRVVYRDRLGAEAAYNFVKSSNLFGEAKCYLRDVAVAASETEPGKVQKEDTSTGLQPAHLPRPSPAAVSTTPGMQLKSILKKAGGEEAGVGNGGNGGRGTPRVKFMLGGEESNRGGEQTMTIGNKNNFNNNASFADGGSSSSTSSHATMDFNSKNFQKVNLPPHLLPPILQLPLPNTSISTTTHAQSTRPQNILHYSTELVTPQPPPQPQPQQLPPPPPPPRNALHNYDMPVFAPPSTPNVDIAPQMLSLLTKCNEVVTNVRNCLGYVPYHPL